MISIIERSRLNSIDSDIKQIHLHKVRECREKLIHHERCHNAIQISHTTNIFVCIARDMLPANNDLLSFVVDERCRF